MRGYTIIELIFIIAIVGVLMGITTISLLNIQHKTNLKTTVDTFIADIKSQQIKAMTGATEGGGTNATAYGMHISSTNYTLFNGTIYSAGVNTNFTPSIPSTVRLSTTISGSNIIFATGSGELLNATGSANTVTFTDTGSNEQKSIIINRYGVVTGVN